MPNDLLKFLGDPAERDNIRQGFLDAVNRGAVGGLLGFPVDTANMLLNVGKAGVGFLGNKTGLISADQMPELIDNPVGGSEWFGKQMQNAGMVSDKRNQLAEALAGFLPMSPSTSAKAVAAVGLGGIGMMDAGAQNAMILYHGSNQPSAIRSIHNDSAPGNLFNGLFASPSRGAAASHGDALYRMTIPDEKVLTQRRISELPEANVQQAAKHGLNGPYADDIAQAMIDGGSAQHLDVPTPALLQSLRADDMAEADWAIQRLRGEMSRRLGFDAVEMPDEHGVSFLVTGGARPRPANQSAVDKFRGVLDAPTQAAKPVAPTRPSLPGGKRPRTVAEQTAYKKLIADWESLK